MLARIQVPGFQSWPCLLLPYTLLTTTMPSSKAHTNRVIKVDATMVQQYRSLSRRCLAAVWTSHCSQCTCGLGLNTPAMVCTRDSGSLAERGVAFGNVCACECAWSSTSSSCGTAAYCALCQGAALQSIARELVRLQLRLSQRAWTGLLDGRGRHRRKQERPPGESGEVP
jgi:hypothetical protein